MNNEQFRAARLKLGLTQIQLAKMLEIAPNDISRIEGPINNVKSRHVPVRAARLIRAYLDGHRPNDWPQTKEVTK